MDVIRQFSEWTRQNAVLLVALCGLSAAAAPLRADAPFAEDAVKAAFLYRFTGYVDWPSDALTSPQFTIAVFGAEGVARELERTLAGHELKNRMAAVRRIKSLQEVGDAQILYVGAGHARELRSVISLIGAHPVLFVTDEERGLDTGSAVNFLVVDRRVRFEVSLAGAERAGLKISSELLSVAARVQGGHLRSDILCTPSGVSEALDLTCTFRVADAMR
jgi:hypothetical protein